MISPLLSMNRYKDMMIDGALRMNGYSWNVICVALTCAVLFRGCEQLTEVVIILSHLSRM